METLWQRTGIYLGITIIDCCLAYPIDLSSIGDGVANGWGALLAAVVFSVCSVLLLGCMCCRNDKGFQEFTDSTSSHSVSTAGGYANSSAELTVFPPASALAIPGDRSSVVHFEPLPDIRPQQTSRRPAAFTSAVSHGLSAHDWFQVPGANFPRNQMKYVRELGRGWFGRVVEGEAHGLVAGQVTTSTVVVKILHEDATATDQMYFLHEVKPYRDLVHPNILRLVGRCLETDPFLLLLEWCPGGDLKSFLTTNIATADALNQQGVTLLMACNIAAGLHHMLDKGYVHTDLAARNCLVAPDLTVKIGDYGTSIETYKEEYYCAGDVALPIRWCAPETLHCTDTTIETKEVTASANVWSLGVVLWEICQFGKLPYAELTDEEVIVKVLVEDAYRLSLPTVPSPHQHNLYQVMKQCWSPGSQRPALGQVLRMLNHLYASRERHKQDGDNSSLGTDEDFERRWDLFKPNTIPKMDNSVTTRTSVSAVQSPVKDSEMLVGHQAIALSKFGSADALLPDFVDQGPGQSTSRRDSENLGSATPLTTSPQPSLSSSTGGEFFLPSIRNCHKSPSLQNLRGSVDDLSEGLSDARKIGESDSLAEEIESQEVGTKEEISEIETASEREFDSWLKGVSTTSEEDAKFVRKISEAIRDLDDALALEKTSSSSSGASSKCASNHSTPAKQTAVADQNVVLDFRLGNTNYQSGMGRFVEETFQLDSFQDQEDSSLDLHRRISRGTDSGTDTEDETWRRRVEQGEFTKKVKEKSKSVADLMILTHIDCSDGSDSDTPSLTWNFDRSLYRRSSLTRQKSVPTRTLAACSGTLYGSDSNICGAVLDKEFEDTLYKLRAALDERRSSAESEVNRPDRSSPVDVELSGQCASGSEETLLNFLPEEKVSLKNNIGEEGNIDALNCKENNFLSHDASDKVESQCADLLNVESQTSVGQVDVARECKSVLEYETLNEVPNGSNADSMCSHGLNNEIGISDTTVHVNKTYIVHNIVPERGGSSEILSYPDDVFSEKCNKSASFSELNKINLSNTEVDSQFSDGILNVKQTESRDGSVLRGSNNFVTSTPMPNPNRTNERMHTDLDVLLLNLDASAESCRSINDPAGNASCSIFEDKSSLADTASKSFALRHVSREDSVEKVVPGCSASILNGNGECDLPEDHKKTSVIIGPCDDYTLDYFKGLKTTFVEQNRIFSSLDFAMNGVQNANDQADFITDVDYSIDPWDRYMENDQGCGTETPLFSKYSQENILAVTSTEKLPCRDITNVPHVKLFRNGAMDEDVFDFADTCRKEQQGDENMSVLIPEVRNDGHSEKSHLPSQDLLLDKQEPAPFVFMNSEKTQLQSHTLRTDKQEDPASRVSLIEEAVVKNGEVVCDASVGTLANFPCESSELNSKDVSPSNSSSGICNGETLVSQEGSGDGCVSLKQVIIADKNLTLPSVHLIAATPLSSGRNSPELHITTEVQRIEVSPSSIFPEGNHKTGNDNTCCTSSTEILVLSKNQTPLNIERGSSIISGSVVENCEKCHPDVVDVHSKTVDHEVHIDACESGFKNTQTPDLQAVHSLKEQTLSSCPLSPRMGEKGRLETCDSSGTEDSAFDFPRSDDVSIASSHCRDVPFDRPEPWEVKDASERPEGFTSTVLNDVTMPGVKINVESFQREYQINRCEVGAQLDEDGDDDFGLDIAKHSTPDDERSSDSGFRDKGSLSESCEDACDEKYHLEDIEAELEETFNRGGFAYVGRGDDEEEEQCGHEECAASHSSCEDVVHGQFLLDADTTMQTVQSEQDDSNLKLCDSNQDSLEGTLLATPSHGDEINSSLSLSFIVSEQKHTELLASCSEDGWTPREVALQANVCLDETYVAPAAGSGWYLHPPVDDTRQAVQTDDGDELPCHSSPKSSSSTCSKGDDGSNGDHSYMSFSLDEEFATAIRNELREKLSCGLQHSESEGSDAEEEDGNEEVEGDESQLVVDSEDDLPQEERTDVKIHYNTYPASLSPILEEGESLSSLTTTLSDQFSPFLPDVVAGDCECDDPMFVLDLEKDGSGKHLGFRKFEEDIREALANCSLSSEDTESSGTKEMTSGVLVEDLDPQTDSSTVVHVQETAKRLEEDDLLMVDVETNKAVLVESPTPKSHLAFVQSKTMVVSSNVSLRVGSSDSDGNVTISAVTHPVSSDVLDRDNILEGDNLLGFDASVSPKREEIFTPDSISPDVDCVSPASTAGIETPNTDNMSDYFLTPDTSVMSSNDILCVSPLVDSQPLESNAVSDTIEKIHYGAVNNEAAEIISDLESGGFMCSNKDLVSDMTADVALKNDHISSFLDEHFETSLEGSSCSSESTTHKLSELASSMLGLVGHQQTTETSDSNDSSYLSPDKQRMQLLQHLQQQDCCSVESSMSELSSVEDSSTGGSVRNQLEVFLQEERDWSKPSPEAVLLSTKAPMPSPEEEAWKKLPSVLALSDLSNVRSRCSVGGDELEDASYTSPSQAYCSQDDDDMMSTSFSNRDDDPECYTPDWESESEDTNEDENSSSSGEFIWKDGEREERVPTVKVTTASITPKVYEGLGEFPMEAIVEEDEDESSSSGSGTEFVPSAWNSRAKPGRSALRSPDKKSEQKKSVSFKRQKYHCVYEYPREVSDSETEGQDRQPWSRFMPGFDYASYADWELDGDASELTSQDLDNDLDAAECHIPQQLDFYKLSSVDYDLASGVASDGDFFTSSSYQPFILSTVSSSSVAKGAGSQFFPGLTTHRASEDADVDSILLDFVSGDEEVDACDEEIDTSVAVRGGGGAPAGVVVAEEREDEEAPPSPSVSVGLGELRHTRDRLKLDLGAAVVAGGKRAGLEPVQGEASLLDSGIESGNGAQSTRTMQATLEHLVS